jgi:hypothetical protein
MFPRPTASKVEALMGCFGGFQASKGIGINRAYGAGDGNRTHASEVWFHAATARARLYRNGRAKVAASVHCRPPQPFLFDNERLRRLHF